MAQIDHITMSWKDNYVSFNDEDLMTDYFHGYSLGVNSMIEWVKKDGGKKITVEVTNDDKTIPALKRVLAIAKAANYTIEEKSGERTYHGYMDKEVKIFHFEWLLTASAERNKAIDEEEETNERRRVEALAYSKSPQAIANRIKEIENCTAIIGAKGFHILTQADKDAEVKKILSEVESWEPVIEVEKKSKVADIEVLALKVDVFRSRSLSYIA